MMLGLSAAAIDGLGWGAVMVAKATISGAQAAFGAERRRLPLARTEATAIVVPLVCVGHNARAKHDEGADAEGSDDEIDVGH